MECIEVIETEKDWFIVSEFCEGGELFEYVQKFENLQENEACEFLNQLLDAVEYLHEQGIAHRDLKLENILLDGQKNVKIIDFGMSTNFEEG